MRYNCGNYNALRLNKWHSERILSNVSEEMITMYEFTLLVYCLTFIIVSPN